MAYTAPLGSEAFLRRAALAADAAFRQLEPSQYENAEQQPFARLSGKAASYGENLCPMLAVVYLLGATRANHWSCSLFGVRPEAFSEHSVILNLTEAASFYTLGISTTHLLIAPFIPTRLQPIPPQLSFDSVTTHSTMSQQAAPSVVTDEVTMNAFHKFLTLALAQAKAERLLDEETLASAEADIMVAGT